MERRCLLVCSESSKSQPLASMTRRIMNAVNAKFGEADITKTHHLGFCDLSKFGRLTALAIDEVAKWAKGILDMNPDFSTFQAYVL